MTSKIASQKPVHNSRCQVTKLSSLRRATPPLSLPQAQTQWLAGPNRDPDFKPADDLLVKFLTSEQKLIDLSRGQQTVLDFGIGLYPYATARLADGLGTLNPDISVIGTDRIIPSAIVQDFSSGRQGIFNQSGKLQVIKLYEQEALGCHQHYLADEEVDSPGEGWSRDHLISLKDRLWKKALKESDHFCRQSCQGALKLDPYAILRRPNLTFVEAEFDLPENITDLSAIILFNVLMSYPDHEKAILAKLGEYLKPGGIIFAGQRSLANHWLNVDWMVKK